MSGELFVCVFAASASAALHAVGLPPFHDRLCRWWGIDPASQWGLFFQVRLGQLASGLTVAAMLLVMRLLDQWL
jgi:hypothetical protein